MTSRELRNSILRLAVEGKLVPQDPVEGTGEELYQKIQAEKNALAKAGKWKEQKPLPEITDDEIPFDIPDSWKYCCLADCGMFISGYTPKKNLLTKDGEIPYFKVADMNTAGNELFLKHPCSYLKKSACKRTYRAGAIVYPKNGGAVFTNKKRILFQDSVVDLNTGGYIPSQYIDIMYVYYFFSLIDFRHYSKGSALPTLDMCSVKRILIPLPPLAEQKRIVAKLSELLPLVDRYGAAQGRLEEIDRHFPADMRKAILRQAVEGKLVPQDPAEGTGEELYRKIQAEKNALAKAGKWKKQKPLPEITDDEIPFDIPDSWKWVRLEDYCIDIFHGKAPKYVKTPTEYRIIGQAANQQDGIDYSQLKYTNLDFWKTMDEKFFLRKFDVLLNSLGNGSLGRSGILIDIKHPLLTDGHLFVFRMIEGTSWFLYFYLQYRRKEIEMAANGSTNQIFLSLGSVKKWLIPLPPLAEQKRIVAKIEEVFAALPGVPGAPGRTPGRPRRGADAGNSVTA